MIESGWKVKAKRRGRSKRRESRSREEARRRLEERTGQSPASPSPPATSEPLPSAAPLLSGAAHATGRAGVTPAPVPQGEQLGSQSARAWLMLAAGVLMSVGVMHTLVLQPLLGKVDALQASVEALQADLASVSGVGARIDEGTNLLSAMSRQRAELEAAGEAISEADRLTQQTAALSGRLDEAEAALARMRQLGETLTGDAARLSITRGFGPDADAPSEEASGPAAISARPARFATEPETAADPEQGVEAKPVTGPSSDSESPTDMGPVLRF